MASLWDHVGIILGPFGDPVGIILASFWDNRGIILGQFWNRLGSFWAGCSVFGVRCSGVRCSMLCSDRPMLCYVSVGPMIC